MTSAPNTRPAFACGLSPTSHGGLAGQLPDVDAQRPSGVSYSLAVPPSGASDTPCNADLLPSKAGRPTHSRSGVNLRKTRAEKLATASHPDELAMLLAGYKSQGPLTGDEIRAHSDRARELGGVGR